MNSISSFEITTEGRPILLTLSSYDQNVIEVSVKWTTTKKKKLDPTTIALIVILSISGALAIIQLGHSTY